MDKVKIELLAPAGSWEAFLAAVENGADAVYLGGKLFNARQFAGNFDREELKKVLDYAHLRDVKIYLTMNTLIGDSELTEALEQVEEAYRMGIDGIIVQDIGFAGAVKKIFPDLDLHGSTQMTVYNKAGVKVLEDLGFKRVVLARELSITEIQEITESTSLDIEVFIHGALCVSYSGQCLMSSVIGGRSGNRGKCAQPCRMKYELVSDRKMGRSVDKIGTASCMSCAEGARYIMSPKDICSINELNDLIKAGVRSLKIEGRMKTPEYVATVVKTYRKYLDAALGGQEYAIEEKDIKNLTQIFNRGGFSKGYLKGKTGRDMMSYEKPKNWGLQLGEVISYDRNRMNVKLKLIEEISIGDGIEVWNGEDESPGTIVTEIKTGGKNALLAKPGEIVELGSLKGKIYKGNKVYKTSDKRLNNAARESFENRRSRKTRITGKALIKKDSPMTLQVRDNVGNEVYITSDVLPENAVNRPITVERLAEQLHKTGATPFEFADLKIELEDGLAVPVSEINNIRRRALEQLESKRIEFFKRNMSEEFGNKKIGLLNFPGNSRKKSGNIKISLFMQSYNNDVKLSELDVDRIYLPFSTLFEEKSRQKLREAVASKEKEVYLWIPGVTRGNYDRLIRQKLQDAGDMGIDGLMAGNIWSLNLLKENSRLKVMGDYSLNVFNSLSMDQLAEAGFQGTTLSAELTLSQIEQLKAVPQFQKEVVVYGRLPVMISEYCPVGSIIGGHTSKDKCRNACIKGGFSLRDRKGMEFPVICDKVDCRSTILNTNVIFIGDSLGKIKDCGVDIIRINIWDENIWEVTQLIQMHRDVLKNGTGALGKYDDLIEEIRKKGYTKGHYFRGV